MHAADRKHRCSEHVWHRDAEGRTGRVRREGPLPPTLMAY